MNEELLDLTEKLASLTQLTNDHIKSDEHFQMLILEKIDRLSEKLDPIAGAYDGVLFGKKLITGVAATVLAVASIGGAVFYLYDLFSLRK